MRIEVTDTHAKLFLNSNKQPSLVVNDLKNGAGLSGTIGFGLMQGQKVSFLI
jgi:hypothetical protein